MNGIGHNQPPLEDRLALDYAELLVRAKNAGDLVPDQIRAIASDEEADAYVETSKTIKGVIADATKAFTPEKEPWNTGGKTVDDFFGFRKSLKAKDDRVVSAINAWQTKKRDEQRAAEAMAAELAKAEAAMFDEPAPVIAAPAPVKDVARIVTSSGTMASGSLKWVGEVTDPALVPRQYLIAYQPLIDAAIKGGVREIPGVRIYETVRTSIRR